MERLKCEIHAVQESEHSLLVLLAEETLRPLAEGAGHPELYQVTDLLSLLARAEVFAACAEGELVGFVAVEAEGIALAVRCVGVHPAFEDRGVADQLLDWAEGVAIDHRLERMTALVPVGDAPSLHLYHGHGFVTLATTQGDAELQLEKRLPAL